MKFANTPSCWEVEGKLTLHLINRKKIYGHAIKVSPHLYKIGLIRFLTSAGNLLLACEYIAKIVNEQGETIFEGGMEKIE